MRSDEVLRNATDRVGVKAVAAELKLSPALIYKWCKPTDPDDPDTGGARNPLDRLADIIRVTESEDMVNWLCHQAGGFFVKNPVSNDVPPRLEMLNETQKLVLEFSHLLSTVTKSIEDDGFIEESEAGRIRQSWEKLKSSAEGFTVACEQGKYAPGENEGS